MSRNNRKQTKATPYLLIIRGARYGCYSNAAKAREIGEASGEYYQVYRGDECVEQG